MIRAILMLGMMCVLLVGAGLWFADDRLPPELEEALGPVVDRTIEVVDQTIGVLGDARQWLPATVAALSDEAAQVVESVESSPEPESLRGSVAADAVDEDEVVVKDEVAVEDEVVVEIESDPFWDEPFRDDAGLPADAEMGRPSPAHVAAAPDQEKWAHLIRRMLRIYDRVETGR